MQIRSFDKKLHFELWAAIDRAQNEFAIVIKTGLTITILHGDAVKLDSRLSFHLELRLIFELLEAIVDEIDCEVRVSIVMHMQVVICANMHFCL